MPDHVSISLSGRAAVVTGAARGIGRAIAVTLARAGAAVAVTDLPADAGLLEEVVSEISRAGGRAVSQPGDVSRRSDVDSVIGACLRSFGRIDILVNNAGVHLYPRSLLAVTEQEWDRVMAINVKGALFACQAAIPHMQARGAGAVVNVASDSAFDVIADEGGYGISKIAVVRMASYLAKELSGTGVRVNSLAPGWVKTRLTDEFFIDPQASEAILAGVPARRVADSQEIADVTLFLVSDLASYVNGHCIVVDGGRVAGLPA